MKKTLPLTLLLAVVLAGMPQRSDAQNKMSATWAFTAGGEGQSATLNDDKLFASTYVTIGNNISYKGTNTGFGVTFSQIEAKGKASTPGENETLAFHIIPQKGVTFTPTSIEFDAARFGTDGGYLNITLKTDDGQSKPLATGAYPTRPGDGYDTELSHFSYSVSGISSSEGLALEMGIYNLNGGKSVGFAHVTISGTYEGSPEEVAVYKFAIAASPQEGGDIVQNPVGTSFNEGTRITLIATENFGYDFVNWTDAAGKTVAEEPSFTHTLTADAQFTANFKKVNTYALDLSIEGDAADYMVTLSPEPTLVDDKMMYEEGTNIILTASSNPILTFTHWSTGETANELTVKMTEDKTFAAHYDADDYVAGWDFHKTGNNGRKADFYSEGNDAATLILRNADGTTQGWLDKSQMAAGGYEGRPAAVNWKPLADKYYYQTCVDASMHTDLKVLSSMLYNYNAYQKQKVEYSLDGNDWKLLGTIDLGATSKVWKTETFDIPADANHQSAVYIRWIPDYTSPVVGTTSEKNDGTAISGIYITGTEAIVDDGTVPELLSHVPETDAKNASVNGRIVLTFDEKIKVAPNASATLNDKTLEIIATGKTATCEYSGLEYTTSYTFTLPAGAITDLSGNATTEAISFTFSTRTRPTVDKALFDFVVPDDGTFEEAIAAASKRTDPSVRFRIFVKKGSYLLAGDKGAIVQGSDGKTYPKPTTSLNTPNLSIIGEDRDATVFYNEAVGAIEGLGQCQLLAFGKDMKNTYMQDITLKNGMPYEAGRAAALEDTGDKNIFYNITLFGGQDTYLSNNENGRFYFESGTLQGYTDYLCGKGDVFYNRVDLIIRRKGSVITAPSKPKKYGYVFRDCTVKAEKPEYDDNSYVLGRPWGKGTPIAIFINTTMTAQPKATGWTEMSDGYPARFAEYNSTTASGTVLSLANRKRDFAGTHSNNPELTDAEVAEYTIANVMGGDDNWDPTLYTEQLAAPILSGDGIAITWDNNDYALCYAVCRNGNVVDFTTDAFYTITYGEAGDKFTVRAANEMGGLGKASNEYTLPVSGIGETKGDATPVSTEIFTLTGIRLAAPVPGVNIVRTTLSDGSVVTEKILVK